MLDYEFERIVKHVGRFRMPDFTCRNYFAVDVIVIRVNAEEMFKKYTWLKFQISQLEKFCII